MEVKRPLITLVYGLIVKMIDGQNIFVSQFLRINMISVNQFIIQFHRY